MLLCKMDFGLKGMALNNAYRCKLRLCTKIKKYSVQEEN